MSDDLHRFYVRWDGTTRKGVVKIGPFRYEFDRPPSILKVFDIWYEPPLQMDLREEKSSQKREMYAFESARMAEWVRPIGALVRSLKDIIESR